MDEVCSRADYLELCSIPIKLVIELLVIYLYVTEIRLLRCDCFKCYIKMRNIFIKTLSILLKSQIKWYATTTVN